MALSTPATLAPVSSSTPARKQEHGDDVRADVAEQRRGAVVAAPRRPARRASSGPCRGRRAEAERPGGEAEAAGERTGTRPPARNGRTAGSTGRITSTRRSPAARRARGSAPRRPAGAGRRPARSPASPPSQPQVDRKARKIAERDEREPDQVPVALLELRQRAGHADRGAERRARGLRRAGGMLAGTPSTRRRARSCPGAASRAAANGSRKPLHRRTIQGPWRPPTAPSACSSSRTTRRSPRSCSARCASRATRSGWPATASPALDEVHAFLPDLIVLDLGLPRLDGIDVARRLRKDDDDTPILMLTARDALDVARRGARRRRRRLPRQAVRAPGAARAACARCCAAGRRAAWRRCASAT